MAIPEKRPDFRPTNRPNLSPAPPDERTPNKSHRLEVPLQAQHESRSHQPGIDALIEPQMANPDFLEQDWGGQINRSWRLPWGWMVLIALTFCAAGIWSFFQLKPAQVGQNAAQAEQTTTLGSEAEEKREAKELLGRIEQVTRDYYAATTVDQLVKLIRQPEHVRPLMERHYKDQKVVPRGEVKRVSLHPMTVNQRASFWYQELRFSDLTQQQMVLEVTGDNQPKIDWESEVCYQPMPWDRFVTERPANTPLNFRVFVRPDNFYSHEFTEAEGWKCFSLTTRGSKERLFGYTKEVSAVGQYLQAYFQANPAKKFPAILKLSIPANTQSKRGVVIEKLVNSLWLDVDPPKSDD